MLFVLLSQACNLYPFFCITIRKYLSTLFPSQVYEWTVFCLSWYFLNESEHWLWVRDTAAACCTGLSFFTCSHRAHSGHCSLPSSLSLQRWNGSSSHCQAGNLLTAGAVPRREGSSSNASKGMTSSSRSAESIALSVSALDVNSLESNEACWHRSKDAALTQILLPRLHKFFWVISNLNHQAFKMVSLSMTGHTCSGYLLQTGCHVHFCQWL